MGGPLGLLPLVRPVSEGIRWYVVEAQSVSRLGGVLMLRRPLVLPVLLALVAAGCSQDGAVVEDTTSAPSTSAASTSTTGTPVAPSEEVAITDVVYLEMDGHEYLLDVYVPAGEGPWPVVVAFHGGPLYKGHSTNTFVAKAAAEAGMVVFVPNWVEDWPPIKFGMDVEFMRSTDPVYRCAMAFAQHEAAKYGGDPNSTVTYGFSAGVRPAAVLALGPVMEPAPGCLAQAPPMRPVGTVLGDGDYFYHDLPFDVGFDADPEGMLAITDEILDPSSWPVDLSTRFRIWAADPGTVPRSFGDPWDEEGWLAQRDPDGAIREDLDELGQLDDGFIRASDEGLLFATRLQRHGIDATIDFLAGDHTTLDKIPETVGYLLDAAGVK